MPSIDACVFSIFLYWFHCGIHCGAVRQVHQAITWYNFHVDHVVQHIVQRMLRFGQPWAAILFFSLGQGLHHQPGHKVPLGSWSWNRTQQDHPGASTSQDWHLGSHQPNHRMDPNLWLQVLRLGQRQVWFKSLTVSPMPRRVLKKNRGCA